MLAYAAGVDDDADIIDAAKVVVEVNHRLLLFLDDLPDCEVGRFRRISLSTAKKLAFSQSAIFVDPATSQEGYQMLRDMEHKMLDDVLAPQEETYTPKALSGISQRPSNRISLMDRYEQRQRKKRYAARFK